MYNKCITCPKLGITCKGLDFMEMPAPELLEWCKLRKEYLRLTNAKLAELSGTPKGTLDRLFSSANPDYKYQTIRPIVKALTGNATADDSCPDVSADNDTISIAKYQAELDILQAESRKKIEHLKDQVKFIEEQVKAKDDNIKESFEFLKRKNRIICILAILLAICVVIIIAALVIDKLNSNIGFFWIERMSNVFSSNVPNIFNRNTM